MASYYIEQRKRANGVISHRCSVRVKQENKIIHQESKTFRVEKHADAWGAKRCAELEKLGIPGANTKMVVTIGELIDMYIATERIWDRIGRTKRYVIKMLRDCDIANVATNRLTTQHIIAHCENRRGAGAGPSTVYHDVVYLRAVMRMGGPVFGIKCEVEVIAEVMSYLFTMDLVGRSARRTRRPTEIELNKIRRGLAKRQKHNGSFIPFVDLLDFSLASCMRIGEVCNLRWEDLASDKNTILVRDRKDPRKKAGNNMIMPLLGDALEIIEKQPRTGELIFPYSSRSVTAGFQRVRGDLGITDLRYHDLRREGASRLFEMGYSIEEVAQVTGHRDINMLWNVYQEMHPQKMRDLAKIRK